MAGVHGVLGHQLFFFAEVVFGVGQEAAIHIGQQTIAVAAGGQHRLVQFIEQIHQHMVLLIDVVKPCDKAVIQNECVVHGHHLASLFYTRFLSPPV